jgi:hypothetical protein
LKTHRWSSYNFRMHSLQLFRISRKFIGKSVFLLELIVKKGAILLEIGLIYSN